MDEENNLGKEDRRKRVMLLSQLKEINCKLKSLLKQSNGSSWVTPIQNFITQPSLGEE